MLYLALTYLPSILCGVHVVRSGGQIYWIWLFVIAPLLGPAIYAAAVIGPELFGARATRAIGAAASRAMDPTREYRLAKRAAAETASVGAQMRLAQAAMTLGRAQEAEPLFRSALTGQFAHDPALLMGHAQALLELGRFEEALGQIELLDKEKNKDPEVALAYGRAYEGLGRYQDADGPYRYAADRMAGLEAAARYIGCMAKAGRKQDARTALSELDARLAQIPAHFRADGRKWRKFATAAIR